VPLGDEALRQLLARDPEEGWRVFIDQYTPAVLAFIEQAGFTRRDDAMDLYVRVCERLAADRCDRLRRYNPEKGTLSAWLRTVTRHVLVDLVRSRAGRRRLFSSVRNLSAVDREVFELFYWRERSPSEIAELLRDAEGRPLGLVSALAALERVERALTDRQRHELLSFASRGRTPESLDADEGTIEPASDEPSPEVALGIQQANAAFAAALSELPPEDALIVTLKFVDGLTFSQIARTLHLPGVTIARLAQILEQLRARLEARGINAVDAVVSFPEGAVE
jgi:DNA-directed RNA polymerase specialized sigma24 family protein